MYKTHPLLSNIEASLGFNNNASSMEDMGKIMGIAMKELSSSADGNIVQKIVQEELSN